MVAIVFPSLRRSVSPPAPVTTTASSPMATALSAKSTVVTSPAVTAVFFESVP